MEYELDRNQPNRLAPATGRLNFQEFPFPNVPNDRPQSPSLPPVDFHTAGPILNYPSDFDSSYRRQFELILQGPSRHISQEVREVGWDLQQTQHIPQLRQDHQQPQSVPHLPNFGSPNPSGASAFYPLSSKALRLSPPLAHLVLQTSRMSDLQKHSDTQHCSNPPRSIRDLSSQDLLAIHKNIVNREFQISFLLKQARSAPSTELFKRIRGLQVTLKEEHRIMSRLLQGMGFSSIVTRISALDRSITQSELKLHSTMCRVQIRPSPELKQKIRSLELEIKSNRDFKQRLLQQQLLRAMSGLANNTGGCLGTGTTPGHILGPEGVPTSEFGSTQQRSLFSLSGMYIPYRQALGGPRSNSLPQGSPNSSDRGGFPDTMTNGPVLSTNTQPSRMSSNPQTRCRLLIFDILHNRDLRARVSKLPGEDAQFAVDYLNIVAHNEDLIYTSERRRALSLLCKLAKSARVFPRCYELKGIEYDSEPVDGGGFAEVHKGKYRDEKICLKIVRVYQKQQSDEILRTNVQELALWAHLRHKNILPFYGVYLLGSVTPRICLVSPWMEKGNLRDYLSRFPQTPRMPFIPDIIEGLLYLHSSDIVHRDLKAQNVLVSDSGRALITDFGLSFVIATTAMTTTGGTTRFMPPEFLIEDSRITESYDIWSFACLCYEVLTDKMPFYQYKDVQVMRALLRKEIPCRPQQQDTTGFTELDDRMWSLLVRCWNYTPQDRPSCKEIKDAIREMEIQDDRPETVAEFSVSTFWEDMRGKSNDKLDYTRMEEILLHVKDHWSVSE